VARAREQREPQRQLVERLDGLLRLLRRADTTDAEAFLRMIECGVVVPAMPNKAPPTV
jgi:hypothetical protein